MRERKVQVRYRDRRGRIVVGSRWLSQVQAYAENHYAQGDTEVEWRKDGLSEWRRVAKKVGEASNRD